MATSAADATGRFAVRTGAGTYTLEIGFPGHEPHLTQESRRRTARPLLSLFASHAVGGAPREDAPVRTEGPARIF